MTCRIYGNILLICRHEILGWSLGVTILYCIYTVCEGFLTKWRENADFLIPMLQIISHCSISSLAVPWLCSLVPALTILSSGELIPAARFRSCSISSLAVPWLGSLVPIWPHPPSPGLLCWDYDVQLLGFSVEITMCSCWASLLRLRCAAAVGRSASPPCTWASLRWTRRAAATSVLTVDRTTTTPGWLSHSCLVLALQTEQQHDVEDSFTAAVKTKLYACIWTLLWNTCYLGVFGLMHK